ncbi:MAG: hypothetical protein HOH18_01295 [Kordiimonadaceae bacterium]|nr:hypothetical protein [Kordiimonadaceae bacterium]MBT7582805.1 hypothetical protein [Kordiimonadaceae bacterium]
MRIAILGRSELLLQTAHYLQQKNHTIALVGTARSETHYRAHEDDFEKFSTQNNIPFFCSQTLNKEEIIDKLKSVNADIAITLNWPNLIGSDACAAFPMGILNGHAGDLPRYRGNACPNWAIINNEEKIALSIHKIDPHSLDSGDVILKKYFSLDQNIYIADIYEWLEDITPLAFCEALDGLENETLQPIHQSNDPQDSLRCYPRKPEDGKINWSDHAEKVHALIRASSHPFSGAYTTLENEKKVTIWRAELKNDEPPFCAVPGQIMYRHDGHPVIACGKGALKVTEISIKGIKNNNDALQILMKSVRSRLH